MATPHNNAEKGQIAKTVLMPGDPLRAKYIAEHYLENVTQFNTVRNMFGYTGTYKGKEISVMGSGMGMPSIGIYSYELFNFYDVDAIIRVGTTGSIQPDLKIFDLVIAQASCTDSNYMSQFHLDGTYSAISDYGLLEKAVNACKEKGFRYQVGNVLAEDTFYNNDPETWKKWAALGVKCLEMESYALFVNAAKAHKKALTILTVSDSLISHEETTAEQREKSFTNMMEVALEIA